MVPWNNVISSLAIIAALLAARALVSRGIRRGAETLTAEQRKWMSVSHYVSLLLIMGLLVIIWAPQISRVALSVAAFGVAIVIAGKEVILCFTGGIYRIATRPFTGGDWVQVGEHRGEVLREGLLSTQLQELSSENDHSQDYTGHTLTLPNSLLLSHPVINLNIHRNFVTHVFSITSADTAIDPNAAGDRLTALVDDAWSTYKDVAERYWSMVRTRSAVDFRSRAPSIEVHTTDFGLYRFEVRMTCLRREAQKIEEGIKRQFHAHLRDQQSRRTGGADAALLKSA